MNNSSKESVQQKYKRKNPWLKRIGIAFAALLLLCGVGFGVYVSDYYHAEKSISELTTESIPVTEKDNTITVGHPTDKGLVFYPGGKVDPVSYVPLMQELAKQNYYCVIVKMPFNLAVFDSNAADKIIANSPIKHWWIAGHSLGGAMASQYAANNSEKLEGIALLGAYAASDLSNTHLTTLVIYGSEDGVLNYNSLANNEGYLPSSAQTIVIDGGNHAQFGNYGFQEKDNAAAITTKEQQEQTASIIAKAAI